MGIFFTHVVDFHTLTQTEYTRIFYYRDFWGTLSFPPNTTILYLMISCEGKLRNGTKYAALVYLLPISGNSGVQKRMARRGRHRLVTYIPHSCSCVHVCAYHTDCMYKHIHTRTHWDLDQQVVGPSPRTHEKLAGLVLGGLAAVPTSTL